MKLNSDSYLLTIGKMSRILGLMEQVKNPPLQARAVKTKQAIIDAAIELFNSSGYQATTSKDIATKAGVSIGTFYLYYEDKRLLFKEVTQVYYAKFTDRLNEILSEIDFEKAGRRKIIASFVEGLVRAHDIWQGFHDELCVMIYTDPEFKANSRKKADESRASIQRHLERVSKFTTITNTEAAAAILYELGHSVVDAIAYKKTKVAGEVLQEALVDSIERILFAPIPPTN